MEEKMLHTGLLFQDHMVLQRDKSISIWGTADAGKTVTVYIQGRTFETAADKEGNWKVSIGPLRTSFSEEMSIVSKEEKIVYQDIQVGEVWLAGGQSNMEFHMRYDADFEVEKEKCSNDNIRFFDYPEVSYVGQIDEADYSKNYGFWRKAEPEQLERFSAVGYYFAKELQEKYNVPVGIVGCNWGGTPACAWMSEEAVVEGGGQVYLDEYDAAVSQLDLEEYERKFKGNPGSWRMDLLGDPISDMVMRGCSIEDMAGQLKQMGIDLTQLGEDSFALPIGPKFERRPCGLYESMLKPVAPYSVRGIIWYQGETDGDCHPEIYRTLFPALIRNWRQLWNEELPFLFVQLAPLEQWMECNGDAYAQIRAAQQYTAETVPNTAMAVITDCGMQFDIHPKKKKPVGHRLALLAENKVYGEDILCEAPALTGAEAEEGRIILTFENAGEGLYLAEKLPTGETVDKTRLGGLRIFQDGKELDQTALYAKAEKNKVIISESCIQSQAEIKIILAGTGWYQMNLYNSADIPARPGTLFCEKR